jgi:hypothetical protein
VNDLERRYRAALRWYSRSWRRSHGDALLDTLLTGAEAEGRSRPARRERVDLAVRGSVERLAGLTPIGLFVLALLALVVLVSVAGISPRAYITLSLPTIPPPRPGEFSTRLTTPALTAGWVQLAAGGVFVGAAALGLILRRRVRRMRDAPDARSTR